MSINSFSEDLYEVMDDVMNYYERHSTSPNVRYTARNVIYPGIYIDDMGEWVFVFGITGNPSVCPDSAMCASVTSYLDIRNAGQPKDSVQYYSYTNMQYHLVLHIIP